MLQRPEPDFKLPCESTGSLRPDLLVTFPYEYPGKNITVSIATDEFGAVCPWSGLPDFGTVAIEYEPDELILELKSLKMYLYSFRSVGIYQEHACVRICEDIVPVVKPRRLKVTLTYSVRGGIKTVVEREYVSR